MNYSQFVLFVIFFFSVLGSGVLAHKWIGTDSRSYINKALYLAEALLLGAVLIIGLMVLFSVVGLYRGPYLWALVACGYGSFFSAKVRSDTKAFFRIDTWSLPKVVFLLLILIFIFRNLYFLFDVDSIRNYLYSQQIWLLQGSSIIKNTGYPFAIWLPQFDSIPAALSLAIFPHETLFPEFINIFWRGIVFLMLFGYVSFRFNGYIGLSAVMLTMFNDHIFYSGVNKWVIINAAIVGLIFASVYNFWENRGKVHPFRFVLGLIFASQLLANKNQGAYLAVFIVAAGCFVQPELKKLLGKIINDKKACTAIVLAGLFMFLWMLKNYLSTGDPFYPILAGKLNACDWTTAESEAFKTGLAGLKPGMVIKYLNYLFIWPGIDSAKYVCVMLTFMPMIVLLLFKQKAVNKEALEGFSFWMFMSVMTLMAICMACHSDPRYYRYPIAVFSVAAVWGIYVIVTQCFNIKAHFIVNGIILALSLMRFSVLSWQGGSSEYPTLKENMDTLLNRIHTDYMVKKSYPDVERMLKVIRSNPEKTEGSAYSYGFMSDLPLLFFPPKPVIGDFQTNLIKWDSYGHEKLILRDLQASGIKWVLVQNSQREFVYISSEDFAKAPVLTVSRDPQGLYTDYGFPKELVGKER